LSKALSLNKVKSKALNNNNMYNNYSLINKIYTWRLGGG